MKQINTKYTNINTNESMHSEVGRHNPIHKNCKNCSSKCAYDCAQLQLSHCLSEEEGQCVPCKQERDRDWWATAINDSPLAPMHATSTLVVTLLKLQPTPEPSLPAQKVMLCE